MDALVGYQTVKGKRTVDAFIPRKSRCVDALLTLTRLCRDDCLWSWQVWDHKAESDGTEAGGGMLELVWWGCRWAPCAT